MLDSIFVKDNAEYIRIYFSDLLFVEAADKYVRLVTSEKTYLILGTIGSMEMQLPSKLFFRVHRSYIISFRYISKLKPDRVIIARHELPISRQYRAAFFKRVLARTSRKYPYSIPLSLKEIRELAQSAARWQS